MSLPPGRGRQDVVSDGLLFYMMCNKDYFLFVSESKVLRCINFKTATDATVQLWCQQLGHAHAHAHASFISTTTKPLPDSATNTDYDTLTLNACLLWYGEIGHVTVTSCKCPQNKRPSGLPLDIWLSRLHLELPDMQVFLWLVDQR